MEKNSLQQFFEALSSKITGCFLSKNKISILSFYKFNEKNPIDYLSKFSNLVLTKTLLTTKNQFKVVFLIFGMALLMPSQMQAQTVKDVFKLPDAKSCTSKDLAIVSANLEIDNCQCTGSETAYYDLILGIDNKTNSTRTSFAFWGRLKITAGNTTTIYFINGCQGPVTKNTITYSDSANNLNIYTWNGTNLVPVQVNGLDLHQIPYVCGATLDLEEVYEGWTDASTKDTRQCPYYNAHPEDIAPKCDVIPVISIGVGLTASDESVAVKCYGGSDGKVILTFSGGVPPYSINFNEGGFSSSENSPKTYSGLAAGIYTWTVKDSRTPSACVKSGSETVGGPLVGLALGTCSKTDVSCSGGDGSVTAGTVSNAVGTVHYSWKNSSDVEVGTTLSVSSLAADTYTLTVSDDCSSKTCTVTVGAPPAISTPVATVVPPTCSVSTGTVNVTSPVSGVIYTLRQLGAVMYTAVNGVFSTVVAGTYQFFASNGICSAQGNNVIVNPQPGTPDTPTFCVVLPSLCDITKKGSLTITAPLDGGGIDYVYSIDDGTNWQEGLVFNGLDPGAVTGVKVRNKSTLCESDPADCDESNICSPANKMTETVVPKGKEVNNETQKAGFDAYPVPFKDQLTIKYNFDYASKVKIEVFDSQGNLMLSKMDTNSYLNKEIALDLKLNRGRDQVYVVKVTTDRESSTKKVISSR
jgi:hypothetical protein